MKNILKQNLIFAWLGTAFVMIAGYNIDSWQWWVYVFPAIVFIHLRDE